MTALHFTVIIPARFASSRLPGKPLAEIAGKPMIYHTWKQAKQAGATRVVVATDNHQVEQAVLAFGGEVCMTAEKHNSGTERLAEVIDKLQLADDEIIVNVQGDEPLIPPEIIYQVAQNLAQNSVNMATLGVALESEEELFNPNVVKVVADKNGHAMYFSRAPIPWNRDKFAAKESLLVTELKTHYLRHIGLYAYRASFVKQYVSWQPTALEQIESLEQLRVLWHGEAIHIELAKSIPAVGVDTPEDLDKVRDILSK